MPRRYYSSIAQRTTLSAGCTNIATSVTVTATTGFPGSTPFSIIVDADTVNEEVMTVTNVVGTTLTVTRGVDGTSGVAHSSGATVQHGVSARDFDEPNAYINSVYQASAPSSPAVGQLWVDSDATAPVLDTTQFVAVDDLQSNRNLLHNGAMQVAQRGTSAASITSTNYYTADRFNLAVNLGTWTQSVENDAPTGSGFRKSLKMLCTTANAAPAAANVLVVQQYLEGQNVQRIAKGTASAQQLTMSFWVKSNVTGTYIVELSDFDNTRAVSASYTISASATWERKTITFPADTTGAFDNDNAKSLEVNFWLAAGSNFTSGTLSTSWAATTSANRVVGQTNVAATINNYWQITGVQLEVGPVATPFEFKSYDQELRECQRYYWRSEAATTTDGLIGHGMAISTTVAEFSLPITMRTTPIAPIANSIRLWDGVTGTAVTATGANNSGPNMVIFNLTVASGLTQFRPYRVIGNTLPSYIALSADL